MGIPKFFRWVNERYPCLSVSESVKGCEIEVENLYLDMNGIIHRAAHPNDSDPTFRKTEEEIFNDIKDCVEVIFQRVKPTKILYLAVDGVAPRAKMNQQRARRYVSAKQAALDEAKVACSGKEVPKEERFDSNCITPGTDFMHRLHLELEKFVGEKCNETVWKDVKVYLSGHQTPGEGEHKIMDFIRLEKSAADYNANTRHCMYGLDADLIMLGLCTHEPLFMLLREEVKFKEEVQVTEEKNKNFGAVGRDQGETKFHSFHLSLLREYVGLEFAVLEKKLRFPYDLEKVIDDWVMMALLVGNDFIPHLPGFHIKESVLPTLWNVYKLVLPKLDGYINEGGKLNVKRFQAYVKALSFIDENMYEKSMKRRTEGRSGVSRISFREWKDEYYLKKFGWEVVTPELLRQQAVEYVRGIQWNLKYYFEGVPSWSCFFPEHYSPYVSDLQDLEGLDLDFDASWPFSPFQQLLAVLPPRSKRHVPSAYRGLMQEQDSPVIDFFPADFKKDLNGKKHEWEAVVLLPFIDESKLVRAMAECERKLTEEERERDKSRPLLLFKFVSNCLGNENRTIEVVEVTQTVALPENLVKGLCAGFEKEVHFAGFPSFKSLQFVSFERGHAVSNCRSLCVRLKDFEVGDVREVAAVLIGATVYVKWPYLQEAVVEGVYSKMEQKKFGRSTDGKVIEEPWEDICEEWASKANRNRSKYLEKVGIDVGEIKIMVIVRVIDQVKVVHGGVVEMVKLKGDKEQFPYQTVVSDLRGRGKRFEKSKMPTSSRVPLLMDIKVPKKIEELVESNLKKDPSNLKRGPLLPTPGCNVKRGPLLPTPECNSRRAPLLPTPGPHGGSGGGLMPMPRRRVESRGGTNRGISGS